MSVRPELERAAGAAVAYEGGRPTTFPSTLMDWVREGDLRRRSSRRLTPSSWSHETSLGGPSPFAAEIHGSTSAILELKAPAQAASLHASSWPWHQRPADGLK